MTVKTELTPKETLQGMAGLIVVGTILALWIGRTFFPSCETAKADLAQAKSDAASVNMADPYLHVALASRKALDACELN